MTGSLEVTWSPNTVTVRRLFTKRMHSEPGTCSLSQIKPCTPLNCKALNLMSTVETASACFTGFFRVRTFASPSNASACCCFNALFDMQRVHVLSCTFPLEHLSPHLVHRRPLQPPGQTHLLHIGSGAPYTQGILHLSQVSPPHFPEHLHCRQSFVAIPFMHTRPQTWQKLPFQEVE